MLARYGMRLICDSDKIKEICKYYSFVDILLYVLRAAMHLTLLSGQ